MEKRWKKSCVCVIYVRGEDLQERKEFLFLVKEKETVSGSV